MAAEHLVFYDGECGMCDRVVQFLLEEDVEAKFVFAPLQGKTAETLLKDLPPADRQQDSLILIENYRSPQRKYYLMGKAIFRIFWLLRGVWKLLGWLFFFPAFFYDWGYRLVASMRHKIFQSDVCKMPNPKYKERFLP